MATIIKYLSIIFFPLITTFASAQVKVSGFVKDVQTGEMLIGASVVKNYSSIGTATNNFGYFSLLIPKGVINISYVGYKNFSFNCVNDTVITILLEPGEELEEIEVKGQRFQKFNTTKLNTKELLNIPAIGGKPDVMKILQLMPGIQAQSEGTSLINVRGGNPGENLYLIDDVPLIYVNHLGGFISVFNPDMINSIEVYKGGFPVKYGGKLSSIMTITQREGNNKQWKGNLGIGITDASFSVEGPLIKDKASIIVTGRKTLIDPLMMLASEISDGGDYIAFYGFHDLNGKVTFRPDSKNSFHLNFYQGDDYMNFRAKEQKESGEKASVTNIWGNWMLSGRWSKVISTRLFVNNIISTTNYRLKVSQKFTSNVQNDSVDYESIFLSRVNNISLRSDWHYKAGMNYNLDFGAMVTSFSHIPNKIIQSNSSLEQNFELIQSFENAAYISNQITFLNIIDADIGMRFVSYLNNNYNSVKFEPRINVNGRLNKNQSLNFSFQLVNQFAHLLYTSGVIMNNEIWVPADDRLKPSQTIQYAIGWKGTFVNGMFDAELNCYYKLLSNLSTYKEGYSNLLGDGGWRSKIENDGKGESAGFEFLLRKNKGDWSGFIGYTFSETTRQFEGINKGKKYVFDYDRPHSFAVNVNRNLSEKWHVSFSWVYQTGLPYTPVIGRQYIPDGPNYYKEALIYGERNSARMKDYHRLDLGFTYEKTTKKGRRTLWTFSIYNAYNRSNPNAYYYDDNRNYDEIENRVYKPLKMYQISFFPLIPTVSYKVFFE
jgi:hypothetical protein